ncbi:hypothetical protein [Sphaerisporangium corydalis]|uniref:Uncharacterized protein n=1 Tax=Sphaerisporangium corydalis TaxID=1441875 RepID=A0ABV9EBY3_9ACTN|nr:hypothetical protein [Sphaerisporangium corydalis]
MTSRDTPASLLLDAFYTDEAGVRNAPGNIDGARPRGTPLLSKNTFTTVTPLPGGAVRESPQSSRVPMTNKANPRHNPALKGTPIQNIPRDERDEHPIWVYLSPSVAARATALAGAAWDPPIRVSILYGVGFEMNRHGLRSAVAARAEPSALVLVPGIEPPGPRWGVGISELDLRRLLEGAAGRPVTYRTSVLAAFSTGINGLNQTLLQDLVDVGRTERVVIYDCLYEQSSGSTAAALARAKSRAGPNLKIVAYKCTTGGNSLDPPGELAVVRKNPGLIPTAGVVDLFYRPAYTALVTFRCLDAAITDGAVTLAPGTSLRSAFDAMKAIAPARGTVVSSAATWRHVFGAAPPASKVVFETWANDKANQAVVRAYLKELGSTSRAGSVRQLIWGNRLPGWPGGDGEENHDLLLPDFAWEYLPA